MNYMEDTVGVDGTSDTFQLIGNCDIWVSNLSAGTMTLEIRFPGSSTWRSHPDGAFTEATSKTIFFSENGVMGRFVGASNNADVYVRLARFMND
jgi:hypothetical protein